MKKQGFNFLLILLISMISTKALADASGSCGDNVTWTYVEATQTLTISGNGAMYNYNYSLTYSPWHSFREKLKTAVIEEGVTSIGDNAFEYCSGLTSITIPNSVTSIGYDAFYRCSGLTSVTIPNSVTSIGSSAFAYTGWYNAHPNGILYLDNWLIGYKGSKPTGEITIKSGTKGVADYAFSGCFDLTSVTIPNSVTSIGGLAFYGCSGLTSIKVESDNTKYDSRNNCNAIIETSTNELISGCKNTTIPNSVTSIGAGAFYGCSGLTSVTIPNSVTSIGNYAFYTCTGLTSVTIGNSVTSIGNYAFQDCSRLTSITIPNSVTSIGNYAFQDCSRLTSITIPNSVTSIGHYAFYLCSGLTSITIGNSVTSIGYYAFYECTGLTSVTIPNSVTSIGGRAFYNCKRLTSVTIGSSVNYIGSEAFKHCYRLSNINCLNHVPPTTEGDTFICDSKDNVLSIYDIYDHAILNVPNGYRDVYNAAYDWRNFKNIKDGSESGGQGGANVNFTIQMGTIGYTRQQVKMGTSHTIYIGSFGNNRVNAVIFNGLDVTDYVVNGYYTIPEIKGESVLSVTFESNASALSAPEMDNLKVKGYNGEISIDNIDNASSVSVYTADGKLVTSIPSATGSARLQVPSGQLYMVKVGNRTFKLAM